MNEKQETKQMLWTLAVMVALVGGYFWWASIDSEGEAAEKRLRMIEHTDPSLEEQCRARRAVAEAYLNEGDFEKYEFWDMSADVSCNHAELCRSIIGGCGE